MGPRTTSELAKRITTGILGAIAIILLVTLGGRVGVAILAAILSLGMMYEFVDITFQLPDKAEKRWVLLGTVWLVAFVNFWVPRAEYELLLLCFIGLFSYFLFTADRYKGPDRVNEFSIHFRELMYSIFGLLYLGFLPLFLVLLNDAVFGVHWVILFLLIVWSSDTGAYFTGKKYGRRKLYALISPKKTLEGAAGGVVVPIVITLLYKLIFFPKLTYGAVLVVPILVGVLSQVGDLCESFFKRAYDRKDSGSLLPGHGGLLDRFDGVLFALPVMYGCVKIFG